MPPQLGLILAITTLATGPEAAPDQVAVREWTTVPDRLMVIDSDGLTSRCGWFVTLEDRLIALRSAAGTPVPDRRDHPLPSVRAVVERNPNHQPLPMPGLLITADGQRLPGEPRISAGQLLWRNRWTGEVAIPLENIAGLRLTPEGDLPEAVDGDVVELVNGDRLVGLVGSIGVNVTIEDPSTAATPDAVESEAIGVPLERVRSIRLLPTPVEPKGSRAWFADGTVADGRIVADEQSGGMRFIPSLPPSSRFEESGRETIRVRPEDLRALVPDVANVVPLSSIDVSQTLATGTWPSYSPPEFAISRTPGPADAADVILHGPGSARWTLPGGPWILVAEVMPHAPDSAWTSFDLVIRDGEREVLRRNFLAESGATEIRIPIDGKDLSIEVTEGEHGPIADAIRLRRALLLRR